MTQNTRYVNFHARPVSVFLHQTRRRGFFSSGRVPLVRLTRVFTTLLFYTPPPRVYFSSTTRRERRLGNGFEPLAGLPAAVVTWPNPLPLALTVLRGACARSSYFRPRYESSRKIIINPVSPRNLMWKINKSRIVKNARNAHAARPVYLYTLQTLAGFNYGY